MSTLCELRALGGFQEQILVDGFFCGWPMARTDSREVLAEHEIQVVHCVNTIHHFPVPHKLSRQPSTPAGTSDIEFPFPGDAESRTGQGDSGWSGGKLHG